MVKIYHVVKGEMKEENTSEFYDGDVYIVDNNAHIWIWLGANSSVDEKYAGAFLSKNLDMDRGDLPTLHSVDQGQEPAEFLKLLPGSLTIKPGGVTGILKPVKKEPKHQVKLYHLKAEGGFRTTEVSLKKSSLKSDDAFVLDAGMKIYVWMGKGASTKEKFEAGRLGRQIDMSRRYTPDLDIIYEGEEPERFWSYFE
jgi:gelsolin